MEFGYIYCPECERRISMHVQDSGKIEEKRCRDCSAMPGWRKDFDSPPSYEQWAMFKDSGKKISSNPRRG